LTETSSSLKNTVIVGMSTCNVAAGANRVYELCRKELSTNEALLKKTGCFGMCHKEPQVRIIDKSGNSFLYSGVTESRMQKIIADHLRGGTPITRWVTDFTQGTDKALFEKQARIVLRNCGIIDPESLDDYLETGGYEALRAVLKANDPPALVDMIFKSGLRGRGGAGFPAGLKWRFAAAEKNDQKYFICNADEGDPGAFMDRTVLESDPHAVLEGMAIGGFGIGANKGYIYCRAEYPMAIARLNTAIEAAEKQGYLGKNILGTNFNFSIRLKEGAGAFVCGEETALIGSIEGRRGMPRVRPPFPAQSGLFGKPTIINNVETLACVPWIVQNGHEAFASRGTEKSKGTKVFALAGKIARGGLVEVPMGITLREVIEEIGGGTGTSRKVKAVQMGGPSGGCVPASLFETKIDYEEVTKTGAIMGSGGIVVMDDTTCMVDVARYFLDFTRNESCGKCTFCRVGTMRMLEILTKICAGNGELEDMERLELLAGQIKTTSLCALGQSAPNPVLTTLRYFREEYIEHITAKHCRAGKCTALCSYEISDRCNGCQLCKSKCPVDAISGTKKARHFIDQQQCIRCGVCRDTCNRDAVVVGMRI
jgi:NADH-quinone oxidoreductase subunit F